jgi:hypothetical protein
MGSTGRDELKSKDHFEIDLAPYEFNALSLLLRHWAEKISRGQKDLPQKDNNKVSLFREAVIGGDATHRGRTSNPPEHVSDEYKDLQPVLAKLKTRFKDRKTWPEDFGAIYIEYGRHQSGAYRLRRELPGGSDYVRNCLSQLSRRKPEVMAREMLARRFGVRDDDTIKSAVTDEYRPKSEATPVRRFLAASFLDLYISGAYRQHGDLPGHILHALTTSGYSVIMVYYLIVTANRVPRNPDQSIADPCAIRAACRAATRKGNRLAERCPFDELTSSAVKVK